MNMTGLNTAEESSTLPPGDPLPAHTTAFSLASISERGNDSSETTPPPGPESSTTEVSLNSWDNDSIPAVTGWQ